MRPVMFFRTILVQKFVLRLISRSIPFVLISNPVFEPLIFEPPGILTISTLITLSLQKHLRSPLQPQVGRVLVFMVSLLLLTICRYDSNSRIKQEKLHPCGSKFYECRERLVECQNLIATFTGIPKSMFNFQVLRS